MASDLGGICSLWASGLGVSSDTNYCERAFIEAFLEMRMVHIIFKCQRIPVACVKAGMDLRKVHLLLCINALERGFSFAKSCK